MYFIAKCVFWLSFVFWSISGAPDLPTAVGALAAKTPAAAPLAAHLCARNTTACLVGARALATQPPAGTLEPADLKPAWRGKPQRSSQS